MMKLRLFFLTFFVIFLNSAISQKVTGVYKGYMEVDSPKNTINFELTLKEKKGKLYGYCYRLFIRQDTLFYNLLRVNARIANDMLIVEDEQSVSNNFEMATRGIKTVFFFKLKDIEDTAFVLPGTWNTTAWRYYRPLTGTVTVIREKEYKNTQLYKRLADKKLDDEMAFEEPEVNTTTIIAQKKKEPRNNTTARIEKPAVRKESNTKSEPTAPVATTSKTDPADPSGNTTQGTSTTSASVSVTQAKKDKNRLQPESPSVDSSVATIPQPVKKDNENIKRKENDKNEQQNESIVQRKKENKRKEDPVVSSNPSVGQQDQIGKNKPANLTAQPSNTQSEPSVQQPTLVQVGITDTFRTNAQVFQKPIIAKTTESEIPARSKDIIQTLTVFEDSITLSIYDNGEIDGDTVSVFVNNELVLSRIGLTAQAQKITVPVPLGQVVQVSLFAETLGKIPPNTGLIIVYTGDQRYQVFFTSTLEKSASVLFRRLE